MPDPSDPIKGSLFLWPDHWALFGRLAANRTHQHISASLLVSLDAPFALEVHGQWRQTRAALVAPDVPQALDPQGQSLLIVQLDPDSPRWRALCQLTGNEASVDLPGLANQSVWLREVAAASRSGQLETLNADLMCQQLNAMIQAVGHPPLDLEPRVLQVCQQLRESLPERLDLNALGDQVNLSASRLTHIFSQHAGVTLRRFLLHLKVGRALREWQPGMSFSTLAVEAGFYDQPHFVRTARRMFDALPSAYVASGKLQLFRC
ncbi:MAG: AraC family transcriptional regulator [Halomonadaceae bacterium]|nr:MAG: AraC family transcriptional regulator [Halomonadaceae bacterium]